VEYSDDWQEVVVDFLTSTDSPPSPREFDEVRRLESDLAKIVRSAEVGVVDGNLYGPGEVSIYAYGPDSDTLYAAMRPRLLKFPARSAKVSLGRAGIGEPDYPVEIVDLYRSPSGEALDAFEL
jgi:hypothetical protein